MRLGNLLLVKTQNKYIGYLITIIIYLLLFDSIFRKWVMPGLSSAIALIKVPLLVILLFLIARKGIHFSKISLAFFYLGIAAFITALFWGHHNIYVALWGCYPYLISIPVGYAIAKYLKEDDIERIGKLFVIVAFVNVAITAIQFNLPLDHFLNRTTWDEKEALAASKGYSVEDLAGGFRPRGLFMITFQSNYIMQVGYAFFLYFGLIKRKYPYWFVGLGALFLFTNGIFSVSRGFFLNICILIAFLLWALWDRIKTYNKLISFSTVFAILALPTILATPIFSSAINNMSTRFSNAAETNGAEGRDLKETIHGSLNDMYWRFLGQNIKAVTHPETLDGNDVPFWGYGSGLSTQAASKFLKMEKHSGFALAEGDIMRIMCECGYLIGWAIVFLRYYFWMRYIPHLGTFKNKRYYLSLCMLIPCITGFLFSQWGNQFMMCFIPITISLFVAALRIEREKNESNEQIKEPALYETQQQYIR